MQRTTKPQGLRFGQYDVIRKLAVGGMAEIYLAKQVGMGGFERRVVLKCILPSFAENEQFLTMFLDEARVTARLHHPNIVQVLELGQKGRISYIAMEYIHGPSFKRLQREVREVRKGPALYAPLCGLLSQVADGLSYAHEATDERGQPLGFIHRDISSTNLMVSFDGQAKIVDFGVSKANFQQHQTRVGTLKGKLSYMSPEQLLGRPVDQRSDLFSLGIVFYELFTGKKLFKARSEGETIRAILEKEITPPSQRAADLPPDLERILMKMLSRGPAHRYQSARELHADVEALIRAQGYNAHRTQIASWLHNLMPEQSSSLHLTEEMSLSHSEISRFQYAQIPNAQQALMDSLDGSHELFATSSSKNLHTPLPGQLQPTTQIRRYHGHPLKDTNNALVRPLELPLETEPSGAAQLHLELGPGSLVSTLDAYGSVKESHGEGDSEQLGAVSMYSWQSLEEIGELLSMGELELFASSDDHHTALCMQEGQDYLCAQTTHAGSAYRTAQKVLKAKKEGGR